jgi:hypothetical protein
LESVVQESDSAEGGWEIVINLTNNQWGKLRQQHPSLSKAFTALVK